VIQTSAPVRLLAVLASPTDRRSLDTIIGHSNWSLSFAQHLSEARTALREGVPGVVITDCAFVDGRSWKDVLDAINSVDLPPQLIVADRLGDERLWVEILNYGCYDLLVKPFDGKEVLRVVSAAWRSWRSRLDRGHSVRRSAATEAMDHDAGCTAELNADRNRKDSNNEVVADQ
jgi:DNA-binding response OmpR family regulator